MSSYDYGKEQAARYMIERFENRFSTCLDVGACDGNWFNRLHDYFIMDAVEIFKPYIDYNCLEEKYRYVWNVDIADFQYDWYDLIIFGDVIEHMPVEKAQKVIEYAKPRCKNMIIAVPFLYKQDEMNGNKWEKHIQDDLTPELFEIRYPGFQMIEQPVPSYAYYVKKED